MTKEDFWLFKSDVDDDAIERVTEVLERGTWWANGPEIAEFEEQIATRTDRKHAVAFNSGTSALFAALRCVGVEGSEVIVPSFTYPATANAVVAAGGVPVFADIERDSLALDPKDVRRKIGDDTAAIVPIHFGGDVCRGISELMAIADQRGIHLIEDAAHSLGASNGGRPVGSFGTVATFSFAFNKLLPTGEGGMAVTDDEPLARAMARLREQGRDNDGRFVSYGYNLNMSSITAALGVSQCERLDDVIQRRNEMAVQLNEALEGVEQVDCPERPDSRERVYLYYNLRLSDGTRRPKLREFLDDAGIPTRVSYEPVHLTPYYRTEWGWGEGDLPTTEAVSEEIVTLPFHLDLSDDDLAYIAGRVRAFFEGR